MCGVLFAIYNTDLVNDLRRGRSCDYERFRRLRDYAERRWRKTHDLRYAAKWLQVIKAIEHRSPH
jgi:hypothetical protein